LYDFDANPGFTCDSWVSVEQNHTPNQASVMRKHSHVTLTELAEKVAGVPFLQQARPEGVKKVYRALKRDHPSMPAEMKARIAARQGKRGKQQQGPPYKGPVTSKYTTAMRERDEAMKKIAKVLTTRGRKQISEENFALPGRRYPIHDMAHARNALARVSQYGTPAEQAAVRAAVARRFPDIGKEKAATASKRSILKSLGLIAGGAGGAAAGYALGHRTGMARDAETPYGPRHMQFAYAKGQQDLASRLREQIAARQEKTKKAADRSLSDTPKRPPLFSTSKQRAEYRKEVDKYRSEIGPKGRLVGNVAAGGVGAGIGALLSGKGLKRRAAGAALGGGTSAAFNALLLDASRLRHERRGREKKAHAISALTIRAFQDELQSISTR